MHIDAVVRTCVFVIGESHPTDQPQPAMADGRLVQGRRAYSCLCILCNNSARYEVASRCQVGASAARRAVRQGRWWDSGGLVGWSVGSVVAGHPPHREAPLSEAGGREVVDSSRGLVRCIIFSSWGLSGGRCATARARTGGGLGGIATPSSLINPHQYRSPPALFSPVINVCCVGSCWLDAARCLGGPTVTSVKGT